MPIVKIPDCGKGINLDLTPEELSVGVWSACQNMRFKDGYASRFGGLAQIFDTPIVRPHWLIAYQTATKRYWVHAGNQRVFADDGSARVEITRLAEIAVTSMVRTSAVLATVTTTAPHGLTTGNLVTIYGAMPAAFNNESVAITVTGASTFTYPLTVDPVTNATIIGHLIGPGAATNDFTGAVDDRWTGGALGGILVMTNGVDEPQYWAGDSKKLRTLPGWDSTERCQVITVFKQYIIALGITKSGVLNPNLFKWSVSAVPGAIPTSWNEADLTQDAGELDIAETPDLLVDAKQLGDVLVVYKQRSAYAVRLIGQPFIFQVQRLPGDEGMMFRGCAATIPTGHIVMTSGDVVLNNGQGMKSIADGRVRRYLFNNIDTTHYKRAFVASNPQECEILICYPEAGQEYCTQALVWNWKDDTWGQRDLHQATYGDVGQIDGVNFGTWDDDFEIWDIDGSTWVEDEYAPNEARLLIAESGRIVAFDVSGSDDGSTPLPSYIERTGMWLDDAQIVKLVRSVMPRIDAPSMSDITVKIGAAMVSDSSPPTWSADVTYTTGDPSNNGMAYSFAQGRYLALNIASDTPWRVRAVDLDVVPTGRY